MVSRDFAVALYEFEEELRDRDLRYDYLRWLEMANFWRDEGLSDREITEQTGFRFRLWDARCFWPAWRRKKLSRKLRSLFEQYLAEDAAMP